MNKSYVFALQMEERPLVTLSTIGSKVYLARARHEKILLWTWVEVKISLQTGEEGALFLTRDAAAADCLQNVAAWAAWASPMRR